MDRHSVPLTLDYSIDSIFNEYIDRIEKGIPYSSVRCGDGESTILAHNEFISLDFFINYPRQFYWVYDTHYCGVALPSEEAKSGLVEAYRNCDSLGVLVEKGAWYWRPLTDLSLSWYCIDKPLFYAFSNRWIITTKVFYEYFKRYRILLVGRKSNEFRNILIKRYEFKNKLHCVDLHDWNHIERAKQEINSLDFDVALVSAGIPAKIICTYIKNKMGKVAIDFGSAVNICINTHSRNMYSWEVEPDDPDYYYLN